MRSLIRRHGIRNAVLLTQAPTGTTSLLAGVSSGIEPVYDFALVRKDRTGESFIYHPLLQEWRDAHRGGRPPAGLLRVRQRPHPGGARHASRPWSSATPTSSISKTVNAPNDHTVAQVQELYLKAYEYGCKGVTYFRDGCREGVLSHLEPAEPSAVATTGAFGTTVVQSGSGAWPNGSTLGAGSTVSTLSTIVPVAHRRPCPECGEPTLADAEGCEHCPGCGYAACAL